MKSNLRIYLEERSYEAWSNAQSIDKDDFEEAYFEQTTRAADIDAMLDYLISLENYD